MNFTLFGATGGTGRELTQQGLAQGHTITALVRDPAKLGLEHPNLHVIPGNVLDRDDVAGAVAGSEAVVVSLGNTKNNPNDVVSQGTRHVVDAMQQHGVQRLIIISSLGVGDSKDQVPLYFKLIAKTVLRKAMQDKERQEEIVRKSGLDWTIVRPGGLRDGGPTGDYHVSTDGSLKAGMIQRGDVADFVLKQLDSTEYVGRAPAVT